MTTSGIPPAIAREARELGVPLDAERVERVAREQLHMVLSHTRFGTIAATAFAVLLAIYLHGSVSEPLVRAWIAVKLATSALRIVVAQIHEHRGQPASAGWRRLTYALLAIDGAVWGAAGWRLMSEPVTLASLAAAVLACITCVATFGLQVRSLATMAYVAPILLPTAAGLIVRGDDTGLMGGLGLLILLALQGLTARATERRLLAGLLLRLQAQSLVAEKDEALRLAQQQSEVKSRFLAKLSHELRTPLHGILGLARLLHLDAGDAATRRRLELIEGSGTHLLALINDLLDVSAIEAGRFTVRRERFELGEQFDQVAEVFAVRAADKGLAFDARMPIARPCWVDGDPARWRQVLHNLLGNAVKFTRAGSITLTLERGEADGSIRVAVTDTGEGIAPGDLARIFEAFEQRPGTAALPAEGAGLGLTIAREIAREIGGDITVRSEPGRGSTFEFSCRLPPAAGAPAEVGDAQSGAARLPLRVLVAEDDEVNAIIAATYLQRMGVQVEQVGDGRQAVGRVLRETGRPELVLMDCRMPVMDGIEATREIRAQERALGLRRVPIIALTATAEDQERERCLAAGMDDFVVKPFSAQALEEVIRRHGVAPAAGL